MKAKDLLAQKPGAVITIKAQTLLLDAVRVLCENKIGSLLVQNEEGLTVGIITERDVLLEVFRRRGEIQHSRVDEVMTSDLIYALPDDDVDYMMGVMTQNRIRHLPILNGNAVAGMISIGDLIKCQLQHQEVENRYLRNFIQQSG